MSDRSTHRAKGARSFAAYLDLLDTADWLRSFMRAPLQSFDLTMGEFRLLLALHRSGQILLSAAAKIRRSGRQNLRVTIMALENRGLVHRDIGTLPPAKIKESRLPKRLRGQPRRGQRVCVVSLTAMGEERIRNVLPAQAKLVQALMRVLDGREQETLSRLCAKLRRGDVGKFFSELRFQNY